VSVFFTLVLPKDLPDPENRWYHWIGTLLACINPNVNQFHQGLIIMAKQTKSISTGFTALAAVLTSVMTIGLLMSGNAQAAPISGSAWNGNDSMMSTLHSMLSHSLEEPVTRDNDSFQDYENYDPLLPETDPDIRDIRDTIGDDSGTTAQVPLPASLPLVLTGLLALIALVRTRRV